MTPFEQYTEFMATLFAPTDTVCFAFITKDAPIKHVFTTAANASSQLAFDELQKKNEAYNIFVAMNTFKPELIGQNIGRTKDNVAAVKRLYVDADANGAQVFEAVRTSKKTPHPSVTLNTSPGKYQFIWNVDGLNQETAESLLKALAEEFHTDPAVAEIARVLRVPGLKNLKYPDKPEVQLLEDVIDGYAFKPQDFKLETQPVERETPTPDTEKKLIPVGSIHPFMVQIAGRMRLAGLTPEEIEPVLIRRVHGECDTPADGFDDSKIKQVARSTKSWDTTSPDILFNQTPTMPAARAVPAAAPLSNPLSQAAAEAVKQHQEEIKNWRSAFRSVTELEQGNTIMLIENFLPEGTTYIGGLPGDGKTLLGLSIAKALTTRENFVAQPEYRVVRPVPVIYLSPETSGKAFRKRLEMFHITTDPAKFLCRTISEGEILQLTDDILLEAVRTMKPVIILDTAIRFNPSKDENSASQNKLLNDAIVKLRANGAVAVIALHHAIKSSRDKKMSLERMLRGTGDYAATADAVYGIQRDERLYDEGRGPLEFDIASLKPRDFSVLPPFRLIAKMKDEKTKAIVSVIEQTGNFLFKSDKARLSEGSEIIDKLLLQNPKRTMKNLEEESGMKEFAVRRALKNRWTYNGAKKMYERALTREEFKAKIEADTAAYLAQCKSAERSEQKVPLN